MAAKGKKGRQPADGTRTIAANRKAHHDYEIGERFEAGLVLRGSEVKSLRGGKASLAEAWCLAQLAPPSGMTQYSLLASKTFRDKKAQAPWADRYILQAEFAYLRVNGEDRPLDVVAVHDIT